MINVDGEYGGDAPMTFRNHRQHLEIFANTDEIPDEAITGTEEEETSALEHFVEGVSHLEDVGNLELDNEDEKD